MKKTIVINGEKFECDSIVKEKNRVSFVWQGRPWSFEYDQNQANLILRDQAGRQSHALISDDLFWLEGQRFEKEQSSKKRRGAQTEHAGGLLSPMPGKILKVAVKVGDQVKKGEVLLVMEAMKMEHSLRAPYDGTVTQLPYQTGDQVQGGQELLILEENK